MKTRERIIITSLELFNNEGEPNVTTVDIANELDISPGNLYYHFKGKEIIIEEIFSRFEKSITEILSAQLDDKVDIEDSWFYLFVVFEEIFAYRFFYYNLTDIMQRYDNINKKFKRIIKLKLSTANTILHKLTQASMLSISEDDIEVLANNIVLVLTYWASYTRLQKQLADDEAMHSGVFQVMSLVAPHLAEGRQGFYEECRRLYQHVLNDRVL
ncbi:MAG: TetR/AcrR family transcriptional regulator [Pseudomonadales bacterium]|nr:TetR/AcrR family transcriptional regulator [Pseudomonadales bacterium]